MEIKIIQQTKTLRYGGNQTHIFECIAVTHEIVEYKDRDNFLRLYYDRLSGVYDDKFVIGIPETFFNKEDNEIDGGVVLLITMDRGGSGVEVIICKDSKVFITSKGQTIDMIMI